MEALLKAGKIKYRLCVSGAAETGHCGLDAFDQAKELGDRKSSCRERV